MRKYELSLTCDLAANTEKTVIRWVSPATRAGRLLRFKVVDRLAGATDAGVLVRLTQGGTGAAGTAATPTPLGGATASIATALVNCTTEPTSPTELVRFAVPAGGGLEELMEHGEWIECPHSSALNISLTAPNARAANIVNVVAIFGE